MEVDKDVLQAPAFHFHEDWKEPAFHFHEGWKEGSQFLVEDDFSLQRTLCQVPRQRGGLGLAPLTGPPR